MGSTPAIRYNRNKLDPIIKKIVRGLYFQETRELLSFNTKFTWDVVNEKPIGPMLQILEGSQRGIKYIDVFESAYTVVEESGLEVTAWWLLFYKGLLIVCFTKRTK